MSGGSSQPVRTVRMARPKSYAQISEAPPVALKNEPGPAIAQPALGNQGLLQQQQRSQAKFSVQIKPEAVAQMAADIETVVGLLREQILDAGEEQRIVDIVRQWRDADRRLGPGIGTPHLDRFLLMTKMRGYSRSTGRSGFMDQMAMVYEDLFRELEGDRLEQFQAIASASQMYSGPPGDHDAPENFWATMGKKEAVGVWGILKGMGTSAAGMVDAGAWAVTRQMKAAGVDVADPASAAAWLAEQYDISGDAMFGRKEWSEGEELFLGMSAAEFATHGGEGVWMLVMMGKGSGGAKWAQAVEKAIGLSSNMMAIELSANEIVALLDAQYKANGKLDAGLLMQNPVFHQALLRLIANAFGAVAGDKQKAQRISALLERAQLSPIVGQLVEIATSDASVADKKKRVGPVLMELIKQVVATAGAVRQAKQPDPGKGNEGPDEAAVSKSKISSPPVEEPRQPKPPAKLKTKPAVPPVVTPSTQAETPPAMAAVAKLDSPEKSKLVPGNSRSESLSALPPEISVPKTSAQESVTETVGTEVVGGKAINLTITYPKPAAAPETQTVDTQPRAKAEAGNTVKPAEPTADSRRAPELLKDTPLPPELQRQLDLGWTGVPIIGALPKVPRQLDVSGSVPGLPAASVIDFVARKRSASMAASSRVQPEAPAMVELPGRKPSDMVQMMGENSAGSTEKPNRVITVDLPMREVDADTHVPAAVTQTSGMVELPRMGRMGLFGPAPISEVAMPVDRRPDIAPVEGLTAFPESHVAEKTMGKGVKGGGVTEGQPETQMDKPHAATSDEVAQQASPERDLFDTSRPVLGEPEEGLNVVPVPDGSVPEFDFGRQSLADPAESVDVGPMPGDKRLKPSKSKKWLESFGKPFKRAFGKPGEFSSGTNRRTGMHFNERNAAETMHGLETDYDITAGRPNRIKYRVDAGTRERAVQTDRSFSKNEATEGAQPSTNDYTDTGYDRGHLAQREAFKGNADAERAADHMENVVPMHPDLNRGEGSPWRAAEEDTIRLADEHGSVTVEVTPIYDANPQRLPNGTPIPKGIHRKVVAPDGQVLQDLTFINQ